MTLQPGKLILAKYYNTIDPNFDNVSLLLSGEGANGSTTIIDSSNNNNVVTAVGDASISTAVETPFSPTLPSDGVLSFPNLSGDYIETANNAAFQFGSGDFTLEYWIYPTSLGGTKQHVNTAAAGGNYSYAIITESIPGGRGRLRYYLSSTGNSFDIVSGNIFGEIDLNTWNHIALARSGNTITAYLNGVLGNSVTSTAALFNFTTPFYLGTDAARLFFAPGYFSDLRITKGVARYTANFTPPTQPFFPGGAN